MKNKYKVLLWLFVVLQVFFISSPVFAKTASYYENVGFVDTANTKETYNDKISRIIATPRGRLISSSGLQISDEGNGVLGVYAETLCHNGMKEIFMTIYLDIWNETYNDWEMVDCYEYEWFSSAYPDEELAAVSVSFDLTGLSRNREYRLRGYHGAKGFNNSVEMMATETHGIMLD